MDLIKVDDRGLRTGRLTLFERIEFESNYI